MQQVCHAGVAHTETRVSRCRHGGVAFGLAQPTRSQLEDQQHHPILLLQHVWLSLARVVV
jgi:hypothetical protein